VSPFLDYPGHVVNCSLEVGGKRMTPREASALFGRLFMGGLERKGVLAAGAPRRTDGADPGAGALHPGCRLHRAGRYVVG
jgi:hypothetical protein